MTDQVRVSCPEGDFAVESDDEDEIIRILKDHAENKHNLQLSREEIHDIVEDVEESAGIE